MDNNSLISVIIPVYNVKPYLEDALDSVLNQTYRNLEIIIVDDGSNDGSEIMCDDYGNRDSRVRVIHQRNKGLSGARNTGLSIMQGEAVAFLDSDDAYHPDFINKMARAMVRTNSDVVICDFRRYYTSRKMRLPRIKRKQSFLKTGVYMRNEALRALIDGKIQTAAWNKLYKREIWKKIRFPEGRLYEDTETTYCIFDICNTVYLLNLPLYKYRRRVGSITFSNSWQYYRDWLAAQSRMDAYFRSHVPDLFTDIQLENWRRLQIPGMLSFYARCSGKHGEKALCEKVRLKIIRVGKKVGIGKCQFRTRVAFRMLCFCPWSLRAVFLVYQAMLFGRERLREQLVADSHVPSGAPYPLEGKY